MSIGMRIKSLRIKNELSMKQLSDKSGVGQSTISDIENEISQNPSSKTLSKLANAFGVSMDYLINDNIGIDDIKQDRTLNETVNAKDKINKLIEENKINTIAAHFDGEDFSDDEVEDIENFIKFVVDKRNKKKK